MDGHGLSEADAFSWVQKRAMQDRRTMRAVAEDVIAGDLAPEG
jgi:response regulator NasT